MSDTKDIKTKPIVLEQVLDDKNPLLRKMIPGFILSYLKRIIHVEEVNGYLTRYGHLNGIEFIDAVLTEMNVKIDVTGLENIPEKENCIIASNHPLGGLDGLALMLAVSRVRKDIKAPVNDILMNIKNLEELFIPINKHGSNAQNIQIINDTFASDQIICYFPFGLVSRKRGNKIMDLEWKSTFVTKARRFKRDIVPTFIGGRNSNFFYNLSNIRKKLGIKANIEMLYLVDEFEKQRGQTITIHFGKPIPWQTLDKQNTPTVWAEQIRKYVYSMANGNTAPFNAVLTS
ncbi:MAG: 1-acyl-sn-glycerol-3-phosphate acyltransferase [Bacteroidales bacterium]|jgi:putative hemolysin